MTQVAAARTSTPEKFRSAELGWPELHRIPHPPRRVPLVGDVIDADIRHPVQDSMRLGRELGPIFRRKAFNKEIVFVWGADLAADLADESRFAKHVGLGIANLRPLAGDGLFTAYNHEPNWQLGARRPGARLQPDRDGGLPPADARCRPAAHRTTGTSRRRRAARSTCPGT